MTTRMRGSVRLSLFVFASAFLAAPSPSRAAECGQPVSTGAAPVASDSLFVLRAGLGSVSCAVCVCDTDDSGTIFATDALLALKAAVGQPVDLACPTCASTTTSSSTTLGLSSTTTTIGPVTTTSTTTTTLLGEGEPPTLAGITAAHNEVRSGVGVGPLRWSAALAETAQAWAEACVDNTAPIGLIDHNGGRSNGHPYYVGENIYGSSGSANPQQAVFLWASESEDYHYDTNTCSGVCGHYTQVVWSTTIEVGCGTASCPGQTFGNNIVCNYGPGGNTGGRPY